MALTYTLYYEDFNDDDTYWKDGWNLSDIPNADYGYMSQTGLGDVIGRFSGAFDLEKTFDLSADLDELTIRFTFWEIDSWNSENFSVYLNGLQVSLGNFSFGTNEGSQSGSQNGVNWSYTSSSNVDRTGDTYAYNDQAHYVTLTTTSATFLDAHELNIRFDATLNSGITNESYAIDDLEIEGDFSDFDRPHRELFDDASNSAQYSDGWSNEKYTTLNWGWDTALGLFAVGESTSKSFDVASDTRLVKLSFYFMEMDSWDNEEFLVTVGDTEVSLGTFAGHTGNDGSRSGHTENISWSFTSGTPTYYGGAGWQDQYHVVSMEIPEEYLVGGDRLDLKFSSTLNQASTDESWAIDNIYIDTVRKGVISYEDDFDSGSEGWSIESLENDLDLGSGDGFLGRFSGSQDVQKTFDMPGSAYGVRVEFDFLEIDSWDNEAFVVYLNGIEVNLGTFNHNNDESYRAGSSNGVNYILLPVQGPSNVAFGGWNEQVHRVKLAANTDLLGTDQLTVKFDARTNSGINDESYGIDNLIVKYELEADDFTSADATLTVKNQNFSLATDSRIHETNGTLGSFLGRFDGSDDVSYGMTFNNYDLKHGARIEFDFLEIDSWDNEQFVVTINGHEVNLGTFYVYENEGSAGKGYGQSNGVDWSYTTTDLGNVGWGSWTEQRHTVVLEVEANTLKGHVLDLEFDSRTNGAISDESFGIDNIKLYGDSTKQITDTGSTVYSLGAEFQNGHVNLGDYLEVGQELRRGEALVSEDYSTALFMRANGILALIKDEDGDGDYEEQYNPWGSTAFDKAGIDSTGTFWASKDNGTNYRELNNPNSGHQGERMALSKDGMYVHEIDGSAITSVKTTALGAGTVDYSVDNTSALRLVWDNFENNDDMDWARTSSSTDLDWLSGERAAVGNVTRNGNGHIQTPDDFTKFVTLDNVSQALPLQFEFILYDGAQAEDVKISIGDMTNQWGSANADDHRLLFDIGTLENKTITDSANDTQTKVTSLGSSAYQVTITFGDLDKFRTTGGETVTNDQGVTSTIPYYTKVHVDMGANGNNDRAKIGDFRVVQHRNAEDVSDLEAYYTKFNQFDLNILGNEVLNSLEVDISDNLQDLQKNVREVADTLDSKDLSNIDFAYYETLNTSDGSQVDTYYERLNSALVNLTGAHDGVSFSGSASLDDYNEMLWTELAAIQDANKAADVQNKLKFAGFAIALAVGVGTMGLAFGGAFVEEAAGLTIEGDEFFDAAEAEQNWFQTLGSKYQWKSPTYKELATLGNSTLGLAGTTQIAAATYHAGDTGKDSMGQELFKNFDAATIDTTLGLAVNTFAAAAEKYEDNGGSNASTYNGYVDTLVQNFRELQTKIAQNVANTTALAFVQQEIVSDNANARKIMSSDDFQTLDHALAFWNTLGLDAESSSLPNHVIGGTTFYKTKITVLDNDAANSGSTANFDLAGIRGFSYEIVHEESFGIGVGGFREDDFYQNFDLIT